MDNRFIEFYMDMAERCSKMSYAKRLKVGAVIVKNNNIISFSWNGTPSGWNNECEKTVIDEGGNITTVTINDVIHAEENAIYKLAKCNESGIGASMFVTHSPCIHCAKGILQSGIVMVYYRDNYRNSDGIDFLVKGKIGVIKV